MSDKEFIIAECKKILSNEDDIENILSFLRQNRFSKIESIKTIMDLKDITLDRAKHLVHFSKTWRDVRNRDEKFHDMLNKIADKKKNT